MRTTLVTGFSAEGYKQYGERFMSSYTRHNNGYPLHLYTQDVPLVCPPPATQYSQSSIRGLPAFLERCVGTLEVQGKADNGKWRDKEHKAGYSYRFDAHKFCKMVYTMGAAAHRINASADVGTEQFMVWLDGDTVIRQDIPPDLVERTLPDGYDYAYLGRAPKHTETGFLVFKLPDALPVLDAWVDFYESGSFIQQKEWHSAYLFDRAREKCPDVRGYDLTPGGRGHVIHSTWVGEVFDHQKGTRKGKAKSPEAKPIS